MGTPMHPGQPPSWTQGFPPPPPGGPGNHWQLHPDDHIGRQYAGFGSRLGGYLLDALLYGLLFAVFAVPGVVLGFQAFDECVSVDLGDTTEVICPDGSPKPAPLAAGIGLGVIGLVVVAVLYLRALGRTGQTWGRKIAGVKVVGRETGEPLGIGKAILRWLVAGIVSGNCVLGYLWMLWDKDKQTWHDKIVGSVVLKV